jgi:hypothetical protein
MRDGRRNVTIDRITASSRLHIRFGQVARCRGKRRGPKIALLAPQVAMKPYTLPEDTAFRVCRRCHGAVKALDWLTARRSYE